MTAPGFELVVVIDFSAAASPGPPRPHKDRCWAAWASPKGASEPVYFRTRRALLDALAGLVKAHEGPALLAWDFPFGYPAGSGLGGGRATAARFAGLIEDGPDDRNNRFEVADALNRMIGRPPGPFWARPAGRVLETVPERKPSFAGFGFAEWRIVEREVRAAGHASIQSVWKLYTTGSVGSQALMGLAAIHRLNEALGAARRTLFWPFETGWNDDLAGVVHVECWPSLFDHAAQPFAIRDARQVAATRDALWAANGGPELRRMLGAPRLAPHELAAVSHEEGWILGFPSR